MTIQTGCISKGYVQTENEICKSNKEFLRLKGKLATYSCLVAEWGLHGDTAVMENSYKMQVNGPDLADYPDDHSMVSAWQKGLETAQNMCKDLGMSTKQHIEENENLWFTNLMFFVTERKQLLLKQSSMKR